MVLTRGQNTSPVDVKNKNIVVAGGDDNNEDQNTAAVERNSSRNTNRSVDEKPPSGVNSENANQGTPSSTYSAKSQVCHQINLEMKN